MQGIVQELLRLEGAKQKALLEGNAPAYDESVRAQLHALDSASDLTADARLSADNLNALAKMMRQNASLFLNLMSVSPVFLLTRAGYTANGSVETPAGGRIQVEA